MLDTQYIEQSMEQLNERVGLNLNLDFTCNVCGYEYSSSFRETAEFFRPRINIGR